MIDTASVLAISPSKGCIIETSLQPLAADMSLSAL
jgi:hypothetical protein